jgi:hypothetical protein
MRDQREAVRELIERLVRDSDLSDARAREELRRELESHFADCGDSESALRDALARFGSPDAVARGFRAAYRRGRGALYAAKILASVVVASVVGLALELIANLRVAGDAGVVRLGGGYLVSACFAVTIVLVLVAAWEFDVEPLCARLERRPLRLVATVGALFAAIYLGHPLVHGPLAIHAPFDVALILAASATGVAVWVSTIAILARLDVAFLRLLRPPGE